MMATVTTLPAHTEHPLAHGAVLAEHVVRGVTTYRRVLPASADYDDGPFADLTLFGVRLNVLVLDVDEQGTVYGAIDGIPRHAAALGLRDDEHIAFPVAEAVAEERQQLRARHPWVDDWRRSSYFPEVRSIEGMLVDLTGVNVTVIAAGATPRDRMQERTLQAVMLLRPGML